MGGGVWAQWAGKRETNSYLQLVTMATVVNSYSFTYIKWPRSKAWYSVRKWPFAFIGTWFFIRGQEVIQATHSVKLGWIPPGEHHGYVTPILRGPSPFWWLPSGLGPTWGREVIAAVSWAMLANAEAWRHTIVFQPKIYKEYLDTWGKKKLWARGLT